MAEYYINADTGDNSTGDGSSGSPWLTLAHAYDNSTTDDTITCQDSTATYSWVSDIVSDRTIQGESADASGAIFDAGNILCEWRVYGTSNIKNITFQNENHGGSRYGNFRVGNTPTFENCKFHNINGMNSEGNYCGLIWASNVAAVTMTNCQMWDLDFEAGGICVFSTFDSGTGSSFVLNNCTIYIGTGESNHIDKFIESRYLSTMAVTFNNCIIENASGDTVTLYNALAATFDYYIYNSCYHNITLGETPDTNTGSITSDPLLVDGDNGLMGLRPTSPCIDTGTLQ